MQRALVLLGSASHIISLERRKIAWARINPKLKSLASEEYDNRDTNLFGPCFMGKASKRIEADKIIAKVANACKSPPLTKKRRFSPGKSDLHFFGQGCFCEVWQQEGEMPPAVHTLHKVTVQQVLPQPQNLSTASRQAKFTQDQLALPLPILSKSCIHLTHIGIHVCSCPVSGIVAGRMPGLLPSQHNWSTLTSDPQSI